MSLRNSLPQEWPDYFHDDAEVQPARTVPPPSRYVLDFTALQPEGFEQFCWWLLRKSHRLEGCKRLGGSGHGQGGIDLLAFDQAAPNQLIVFECKSGQGFAVRELEKAIERFNNGDWKSSTREFYLILAKHEIEPPLAARWKQVKAKLREEGIHAALWTAHTLTAMVQGHPDVLSKFFPTYPLALYGNRWMQRVAFHEVLSKAFFDPRDHVRAAAHALAQQGEAVATEAAQRPAVAQPLVEIPRIPDGEVVREFRRDGYNWSYRGPWFSINGLLPGVEFSHASAAINFTIPNFAGLTLALSGRWLHEQMLFASGAPVTHDRRGFVVGRIDGFSGSVIDLSSARLRLPDQVVEELASVADAFTVDVKAAYLALESRWGAVGFPFVTWSGDRVVMGVVDRAVWQEITAFAQAHDVSKGDSPWHMFDGGPNVLKPYVTHPERHGGRFAVGYHGIFYAIADADVTLFDDQLAILWQPHERYSMEELSERGWWPCDFAQRWLVDELLPAVRRWVSRREFPSRIGRVLRRQSLARFEARLEELIDLRDLRVLPLLEDGHLSLSTRDAVERLQAFFNAAYGGPHVFVETPAAEALYMALAALARLSYGHLGYVAGNLSLRETPETHEELETAILAKVREHKVLASAPVIDCALRAALEFMPDDGRSLPPAVDDLLRKSLVPLARVCDDAQLARRHQPPPR